MRILVLGGVSTLRLKRVVGSFEEEEDSQEKEYEAD